MIYCVNLYDVLSIAGPVRVAHRPTDAGPGDGKEIAASPAAVRMGTTGNGPSCGEVSCHERCASPC
jgi:hypothetical protein